MNKMPSLDKGIDQLQEALSGSGAFLVARDENGKGNPMTIGWGEIGIVWSRPVFTVLVRRSRYTYGCLLASESFTVNVPVPGELKEELLFCGTKSGRDLDKAASCGLTLIEGKEIETPIIAECTLHYECRILLRKQLEKDDFSAPGILDQYYPADDHHMIVMGEILAIHEN